MAIARLRKLHEDSNVIIFDEIRLSDGAEFVIKDTDGFPVFKIDSSGNVKTRRRVTRI